jgi:hypothetical protein
MAQIPIFGTFKTKIKLGNYFVFRTLSAEMLVKGFCS